jgi:hypothetical protein
MSISKVTYFLVERSVLFHSNRSLHHMDIPTTHCTIWTFPIAQPMGHVLLWRDRALTGREDDFYFFVVLVIANPQ